MIIAESQARRSFIGRLESGQELVANVREFCVRQRIETAFFQGFGYLRAPRIRRFRPELKRYLTAPESLEGTYLAPQIRGTVSFHQEARELNVVVTLVDTDSGDMLAAELLEAEVISFEFTISTFDDVRLFRDLDEGTGLRQWVLMEMIEEEPRAGRDAAGGYPGHPVQARADSEELPMEKFVEVESGDWLEHPRLGPCEVVDVADESRISIRLQTGRIVELHRRIVRLTPTGQRDGHQVFRVSIRKRK